MAFFFKDLEVYKKSLDWAEEVEALSRTLKGRISHPFIDQLVRASLSIPLNIAEGNGRWHHADKRQFFYIARGSTFECVPVIEILNRCGAIEKTKFKEYINRLDEISKMLTGLIQSVDKLK